MRLGIAVTVGAALLALSGAASAGAFYKCERPDGSVEYADAPCEAGAQPLPYPDALERQRRLQRQIDTALCFRPSRAFGPGDAAEDLVALCGEPRRVNRTSTAWGDREQWVYRQGKYGQSFVYVEGGVITAIQD
ncbi:MULTISPECIES: DUF4124 domain-containing protein [unclassified Thioalkalivibrio]|uniref:DUF4124 domain-containing protein n=1 Tax=unclassified Thioalkalivibrio TaxID=2621013 RepID=UPI00037DE8BA|nr:MULTISPECIES: DUF4124 domain-containing protein [unclassified Thioalkalivibrio]